MEKKKRKGLILIILLGLVVVIAGYFLINSYIKSLPVFQYVNGTNTQIEYPDANFAVISDLHMYDPSLGTEGEAFDEVMNSDRKLLLNSEELLDLAVERILESKVDFVLIPGDITKDGEVVNHQIAANKLQVLEDNGIQVYVVPGNHDINNPDSKSFAGSSATNVPSITPEDFKRVYGGFGYDSALFKDENTLSYATEPIEGLYILGLDGCQYNVEGQRNHSITGAKYNQSTIDWITQTVAYAQQNGKAVIVLSHHGIVEHWKGQSSLHPEYLTHDYRYVGELLASYNVRLAFTGHYHAQDIVRGDFNQGFLYDIETGSLVTAPCPVRYVSIENGAATVRTETLVDQLHPGTDFEKNATDFVKKTVVLEAFATLKKYLVSDEDANYIANLVGDAFVAHYSGNEDPSQRIMVDQSKLNLWGQIVYATQGYALDGLWNDLPPQDREAVLPLNQ